MAVKKTLTKMACGTCKTVNYFTKKSKKLKEEKLALKKFCKGCRKHTAHKEAKR